MRSVAIIGVFCLAAAGCSRPAESSAALRNAGPGVTGREVRYNAVLALAHRGSPRITEVWDVLLEMLDEDQQLQNYTPRTGDGRGVPDETAARTTVIGALQAVRELHEKQPKMDLSGLKAPIEKLTQSPNGTVSVQAKQTMLAVFPLAVIPGPECRMDAITIVGAGGIGVAVGYALRSAGVPVTFVDADAAKVAHGRLHGIAVDRLPPLAADFIHFDEWHPDPTKAIWLCTKCYDNAAVLSRVPPSCSILPIQNGFDPQLDERDHAAEGIASFVSECLPGKPHTRITRAGKLHLGDRGAGIEPRLTAWADLLRRAGLFRVVLVPDVRPYKHTKLMYNAAISPLAAAAGLDNGQLLSVPPARRLFFELLRENYAILSGAGLALGKIGPFHPATVMKILRRPALANALAWAFYPSLRGSYCSMAGDIRKGRTEIENYNGRLLRVAGETPCPLNRRIFELVKRFETEQRLPGIDVFKEFNEDFVSPRGAAKRDSP